VRYIGPDGPSDVEADRFVIAGGTYGSPAVLLRSGIGDPDALRALDIEPTVPLPGVGENLHDHPAVNVIYSGTSDLEQAMVFFSENHWMPEEQTITKIRSRHYPANEPGFDLHIYPVGGPDSETESGWHWYFPVACMTPRSRGALTLASRDPAAPPRIEHNYVLDLEGHDRRVLADGVRIARELASTPELRDLLGDELAPGPEVVDEEGIERWIEGVVGHYYHPVGTCAMGQESDRGAVTNHRGRIHGLANAFVADCSIMPVIPRANTNIPAVVIGERIATWLLEEARG
jgi:choline dehydrogenase